MITQFNSLTNIAHINDVTLKNGDKCLHTVHYSC